MSATPFRFFREAFPFRACVTALIALATFNVAAAGNIVEYVYDAAGNIVELKRQNPAGTLAVTGFEPSSGEIGAVITVYGTGFHASAGLNTVKFNGTAATVSAVAPGSLSVTVPSGATSGPVSVQVGTVTATSAQSFTVISLAPTIAQFTPSMGPAGTGVVLTGTNFLAGSTAALNGYLATSSIGSSTSMSISIPATAGSGRIAATNAYGVGFSSVDFVVPPPNVSIGDIVSVTRLTDLAAPASFSVPSQSKHALLLFDGTADSHGTVQISSYLSSPTSAAIPFKVYKPDNTLFVSGSFGTTNRPTIHLPKFPVSGTYAILISPGTATLSAAAQFAHDATVVVGSTAASFTGNAVGQTSRVRLNILSGERMGVGVTGFTVSPTSTSGTTFKIFDPSATLVSSAMLCYAASTANPQGNCDGEFTPAQSGVYTIVAEPPSNLQVAFSMLATAPATGALQADLTASGSLTRVGQDARHSLSLSGGESVALELISIAASPHNQAFAINILRPDGTTLKTGQSATSTFAAFLPVPAPATGGAYTVEIDPNFGAYGTYSITAKRGPLLSGTSPATAVSTSIAGETARVRFDGVAGQNLAVGIDSLAFLPTTTSSGNLSVYKPDGTVLLSQNCSTTQAAGRCKLALTNLAASGTYSAGFSAPLGSTLSANITGSDELTGSLTLGSPASVAVTRSGQNLRYTFSGTTGDRLGIEITGLVISQSSVGLLVYKPDGSLLSGTSSFNTANRSYVLLPSLPATGTYKVLADSGFGAPWQGQMALRAATNVSVGGSAPSVTMADPGAPFHAVFAATAGQQFELGIVGLAYGVPSSGQTDIRLFKSDGTAAITASCTTAAPGCKATITGVSDTYSALIIPPDVSTLSGGTLTISVPMTGTFTVGAAAQAIAIARSGQTARYTIAGTSGQLLRLGWSSTVVSSGASVMVTVLKPDTQVLSSASYANGATGGFDVAALPTTGTYTVKIEPTQAGTTSGDFTLSTR